MCIRDSGRGAARRAAGEFGQPGPAPIGGLHCAPRWLAAWRRPPLSSFPLMCWRFVGRWVVRSKVLTRTTQCMPGCPSGQRERTVNPPALPSEVRIFYLAQDEPRKQMLAGFRRTCSCEAYATGRAPVCGIFVPCRTPHRHRRGIQLEIPQRS